MDPFGDRRGQRVSSVIQSIYGVEIPAGPVELEGILSVPPKAHGIVLFAHGTGSGRFSPRNQHVAEIIQEAGIATLLLDLLTGPESRNPSYVFDVILLAERLRAATAWTRTHDQTRGLAVGYFGASTGAGAALVAAADEGNRLGAVVSRGGRPDLAGPALSHVTAPTLLIVGGNDEAVVHLNQLALDQLKAVKQLVVVPGATHLFEEPGTLDEVARLATTWFDHYLQSQLRA
jgi:putative phosphoribosyl transferase